MSAEMQNRQRLAVRAEPAKSSQKEGEMSDIETEKTEDVSLIAQQVQGLLNDYLRVRREVAALEAELTTRNEDNRRLQKLVGEQQKTITVLRQK